MNTNIDPKRQMLTNPYTYSTGSPAAIAPKAPIVMEATPMGMPSVAQHFVLWPNGVIADKRFASNEPTATPPVKKKRKKKNFMEKEQSITYVCKRFDRIIKYLYQY